MNHKAAPILEAIAQLQRQLDQFRGTRSSGTKLPESLWQAAVELARHGIFAVAQPLRLDYSTGGRVVTAEDIVHIRVLIAAHPR
jgi:hypothetical protein